MTENGTDLIHSVKFAFRGKAILPFRLSEIQTAGQRFLSDDPPELEQPVS